MRKHGIDQHGNSQLGRVVKIQRFAQFDLGTTSIFPFKQRLAQQKAGLTQVRVLLKRILELYDGRFVVLLCKELFTRGNQCFGIVAATACQQSGNQCSSKRCSAEYKWLFHRIFLFWLEGYRNPRRCIMS